MSRLLSVLVAVALSATFASSALADDAGPASAKKKVSVKIKDKSQKGILEDGVEVKLKAKAKKVKVKAASSTFDVSKFRSLAKPTKVKLNKKGKANILLKLSSDGRSQIKTCQGRTIKVTASGASAKIKLLRDTSKCKPQKIDLSRAGECDFIGDQESSLCLLPFPDDYYTVNDTGTSTGKRLNISTDATPTNSSDVPIDGEPYSQSDGFSPGQAIVVRIPGLDNADALAATEPTPLADLGRYTEDDAPVVVIDAETGERHPIWVEIDSNAPSPEETTVLVHPAENFSSGHRYVIAMRKLKNENDKVLSAPEGFRYYRDDLPSNKSLINDQRDRFDSIFKALKGADVERSNLYLAWDFTIASDENIAKNTMAMRNDAFSQLGDTDLDNGIVEGDSPEFAVDTVENFAEGTGTGEDPNMARRVKGTFEVPCYMTPDCSPGGTLNLNSSGLPVQNGTWTANFNCMIPHSSLTDPARPTIYGHGLLGSANEATSDPQKTLGNTHNIMDCATDEIGMSGADVPNTIGILQNMSDFPELADRLQQGMINGLYLGRLLVNQDGFISDPAFRVDDTDVPPIEPSNDPVIDTSNLYYNGNSQGAIFGGALTAIAPDFTRASLGVGGMNYSVLLNRSVDFDTYKAFLDPAYPSAMDQQVILSMIQILWDRGESNGYANVVTDDPLPDTPPHELLMNIGVGDHQVTNFSAENMARTVGAGLHTPIVYDGRWPGVDVGWDLPEMTYPWTDSALVYWDSGPVRDDPMNPGTEIGTDVPPLENIPNRSGEDPHELPRRTPEEQQMVSDFLQPNAQSQITDTCTGAPCFDFTFPGP